MKKLFNVKLIIFLTLILLLINGCTNTSAPASISTQTPDVTLPPTLTTTPSPTLTPTPVPVTIQEAIQRGTFAELEVFNKGDIYHNISQGSHIDQIISLSTFSPNGQQFVAVTKRGIYVYDVESWQELASIPLSPEVSITSVGYSVDSSLFAAGDSSGVITFWNMQTWKIQNSFQVHKGAVTSLDISPDNMKFVTIGDKKEISVWNMSDGSLIKSQSRNKEVGFAYYSLDGKWLYISEESWYLIIWDSNSLALINRLDGFGRRPPEQAISPYINTVATYGFGAITFYDFDKQETTSLKLEVSYTTPTQMTFLDEKTLMVKFLQSDDYFLVDLESQVVTTLPLEALSKGAFKNPEFLHILKGEEIKALGFKELGGIHHITPDGTALILSGFYGVPSGVFDLSQKIMKNDTQEFPWINSVFLSDGTLVGVDALRTDNRYPPFSNKEQQGEFTITTLSPESQFAVKSKVKQVYDIPDYIDSATISPNGKVLVVGLADGNLYLWNLDTKELITKIKLHDKKIYFGGIYSAYLGVFFDGDGSHLATYGSEPNNIIKVLNMENLSEVVSVNGLHPVFSPDGSSLAYVSSDGSIRLISLLDEGESKVFRGDINTVNSIAFSPDGNLLFSGDYNDDWDNPDRQSRLKVWSISDETLLLNLPQYNLISFLVSPDGTRLYIRDGDGVISVWGHDPEK